MGAFRQGVEHDCSKTAHAVALFFEQDVWFQQSIDNLLTELILSKGDNWLVTNV